MKSFTRRAAVAAAALAAGLAALPTAAIAQAAWPQRPVRLIVPLGAGTAPDVIARLLAERLGAAWGHSVFVDNKPGAGGIPGMSALARSANDGYTIGFVPAAMATITPLVYKQPQFNPDTDMHPVATVGISPLVVVTNANNGIANLADLTKQAKALAGKGNLAAPQMNSLPHLAIELVNKRADMKLLTVPYPASPAAITAVIAGEAIVTADGVPGVLQHLKSGRLKALAVTSAQRVPGLDAPPVADTLPGYDVVGWFQVFVPTGTPAAIADRIHADVARISQQPDYVARLADLGIYPRPHTQADAREFFAAQQRLMKGLVADLGVQAQ